MLDSTYAGFYGDSSHIDTTAQLNDSIGYAIIRTPDKAGTCTYFNIASINIYLSKTVDSHFLYADCDVDLSWDEYETYEYRTVSIGKVEVSRTTTYQKKKSTSAGEERVIDHEKVEKTILNISGTGKIIVDIRVDH